MPVVTRFTNEFGARVNKMLGRWLIRIMDERPTIFTSFALGGIGFFMPFVIPPLREAVGSHPHMVSTRGPKLPRLLRSETVDAASYFPLVFPCFLRASDKYTLVFKSVSAVDALIRASIP